MTRKPKQANALLEAEADVAVAKAIRELDELQGLDTVSVADARQRILWAIAHLDDALNHLGEG